MAIYIYRISDGTLFSYCPTDGDQIAPAGVLAQNGLASVSGLSPLDATHQWSAASKTVITVTAPHSILTLLAFWQRFTQTEREGIENLVATGTQGVKNQVNAFLRYIQSAGVVDCNDAYIQGRVSALVTAGVLAAGRDAVILA